MFCLRQGIKMEISNQDGNEDMKLPQNFTIILKTKTKRKGEA